MPFFLSYIPFLHFSSVFRDFPSNIDKTIDFQSNQNYSTHISSESLYIKKILNFYTHDIDIFFGIALYKSNIYKKITHTKTIYISTKRVKNARIIHYISKKDRCFLILVDSSLKYIHQFHLITPSGQIDILAREFFSSFQTYQISNN